MLNIYTNRDKKKRENILMGTDKTCIERHVKKEGNMHIDI